MNPNEVPVLSPCPYCGSSLSLKDVSCIDVNGNDVREGSKATVMSVELRCSHCGYVYAQSAHSLGWPIGRWMELFAARANKHASEVGP